MKNRNNKPQAGDPDQRRKQVDKENEKSAEHRNEKKLPGEYPANEDIMNRRDQQRVGIDVENFSRTLGIENINKPGEAIVTNPNDIMQPPGLAAAADPEQPAASEMERPVPKDINLDDDNIQFTTGNESDVTQEDLQALGPRDLSLDMGEDEQLLKNRVWPVDMAGKDLDIPGAENAGDVSDQAIGSEDEENDFYSLGGDRHEDNLEGK